MNYPYIKDSDVIKVINDTLKMSVSINDSFKELDIDSLDFIEVISKCEQTFHVAINDNKISRLKTVKDLANLIRNLDGKDYLESTQADLYD